MKYQSIFVTGTDTGIGKTTLACGIAAALSRRSLSVGVFKPAQTGCRVGPDGQLYPEDAARLAFFSGCRFELGELCRYTLTQPLAPSLAAEYDNVSIDLEELMRCHERIATAHDVTLIEGAGGLLVPLTSTLTYADFAARLGVPILVVVGSRLGAINHALLTMRYARYSGLRVLGYIVNTMTDAPDMATQTNGTVLSRWLGESLGSIPYLGDLQMTEGNRDRLGVAFESLVKLDQIFGQAREAVTAAVRAA